MRSTNVTTLNRNKSEIVPLWQGEPSKKNYSKLLVPTGAVAVVQFCIAMPTLPFQEIRELCSKITNEPNAVKLVPMLARLRKLLAELKVTTNKVER